MSTPTSLATLARVSVMMMALILLVAGPISAQPIRVVSDGSPRQNEPGAVGDRNFVQAAYEGLLGRSPDEAGLEHWLDELAAGTPRSTVIAAIGDSIEQRRNVVIDAYRRILDRVPDPAGLEFWARGIIDRLTVQELQSRIFASVEFYDRSGGTDTAFVEELYQRILDRDAEPAGLAYWLEQLDGRSSRSELAEEFLVSAEGLSQPPLSILASDPSRNASVHVLRTLDIELDRSVEAESSAVVVAIDGRRVTGETGAVAASPNRVRFTVGEPFGASSAPRSVVATVFAFDGSTVERVDYTFVLAAGGIVAPPTPQIGNPNEMMVAYYGHPTTDTLGIAGEGPPDEALAGLVDQADAYRSPGRVVIPVFEMIATLVTANPGADGLYRSRASEADLRRYLDAVRTADGRLILDIQPGRADVLAEAMAFESLLLEPDVGLAVDPEWVVGPNQTPAGRVGTLDAADINRVSAYLSRLASENDLPPRILIVHRFNPSMVTNTDAIESRPGVRIIFHADGEGGPEAKIADYDNLMPPRFERGFKIFYDEDRDRLSPADVLTLLDPLPAFISYQ